MTSTLAAYMAVTFALVMTPGATTTVVIQQSVRHGRRAGAAAACGAALGNSTHMLLAGGGLALLLRRWPLVFDILRIAGAVYLVWLGLSTLWRARSTTGRLSGAAVPDAPSAVRQGLLVTLLNPSIAVFYLTVVSGFVQAGDPSWMFFLLGAIHVLMAMTAHLFWSTAFGALRGIIGRPGPLKILEIVAGVALIAFGIWLL